MVSHGTEQCKSLNQTMWSQTKDHNAKSCEVCTLSRYYAVQCGNSAPMFRDNLSVPV